MWGTVLLYSFLRVSVFTDNMLLTSPLSQPLVALKTIFVYIIPQEIDRPGSSEVVSCYLYDTESQHQREVCFPWVLLEEEPQSSISGIE